MIEHPVGLRALVGHGQFWLNSQLSGIANSFYSVRATCVPSRYHVCFCEKMSPQTTNFVQKYIQSKVATQSSSDEAHHVSSVSTASTHGNKPQTSVTVAYNSNQESEVTGDHPSSRTSLASLHHIIPELSRSSSPVDLSSSTSSSSTVVQGNSLTS